VKRITGNTDMKINWLKNTQQIKRTSKMNEKAKYWLDICEEDISTVKSLLTGGKLLWSGFICHLIVEKALKAVIANNTDDTPPKIHDLPKLAKIGGIFEDLSEKQKDLLRKLMPLNIEARYPESKRKIANSLTKDCCEQLFNDVEDFLCWIKIKLEN
jgi:HEPN domain-containing protein